jgi:hypothetical protein
MLGSRCRVFACQNQRVNPTEACDEHQPIWKKHSDKHSQQHLSGIRRMLRQSTEIMPWQIQDHREAGPHDQEAPENLQRPHYFSPARYYCVETICAPCGVVIAWTKFDKAESPTNILNFLESVYPTQYSRPQYVCIDKACMLLRTANSNGSWDSWQHSTRFIVDSYHYTNHQASDILCRKWCNPAPTDGSAPNLVVVARDRTGKLYYKRAFNTQACEQLNAWLGGFESILKRMTPGNFNWFLHSLLFLHTQYVLKKQNMKKKKF